MEHFRIEGASKLAGTIAPMGNKNSALPLLAAAVLTDDALTLGNVPDIGDVRAKLALLRSIGVESCLENSVCHLDASGVCDQPADAALAGNVRTSPLLAGPLLNRFGHAPKWLGQGAIASAAGAWIPTSSPSRHSAQKSPSNRPCTACRPND